ncbi:MAG: family 16 glycoside hydrolase [bacterium]
MNFLTGTTKKLCFILGVLSFCLFITTAAKVQLTEAAGRDLESAFQGAEQSQDGFLEDFDRGMADNWIDDESGVWSITDKVYRMTGTGTGALRASCYNATFGDFAYQVDVRRMQGNLDASQGLLFRLNTNGDFYVFALASSGYYSAYKFDSRNGTEVIPWTTSSAIKQGAGVWNTMKVVCKGPAIDFYINGTLLKTVRDNNPYLTGMVGLVAVDEKRSDQGNPIVDFDNARLSISGRLSPPDSPVN